MGDHIVLGRAYLADGQIGSARAEFQSALDLDRENVVALKALGGILSHEGSHAEAASYYQAVCRVDPGDLESQTALHQITSGEFPEIRPADVIVGQGSLAWQPVRLPREEEHLSELALGLRTIERYDASRVEPGTRPYETSSHEGIDLSVERNATVEESRPDIAARDFSMRDMDTRDLDPRDQPTGDLATGNATPAGPARLDETPPESPRVPAEAMARSQPAALGDVVEHHPPVEIPRAPGKVVEVNKSAFETWLRQLSGKE